MTCRLDECLPVYNGKFVIFGGANENALLHPATVTGLVGGRDSKCLLEDVSGAGEVKCAVAQEYSEA